MTRHPESRSRAKLLRSLYIWHRYIGLSAALFVCVLSATGLALNHTESLQLDSNHVQTGWLLDWYGIHAPDYLDSYAAGPVLFTAVNERVFRDSEIIDGITSPLVGAIDYQDLTIVATLDQLTLLTRDGERIESIGSAAGVPAGIRAIGITANGAIAVQAATGYYLSDENLLEWSPTDTVEATWSTPSDTPPALAGVLKTSYRGHGLPLERVVLDLHSGRLLGDNGVLLVDAAAILFLLLAISGVWLWSRRRASARAHRHNREQHEPTS
ncbi:MAG: PepSY domain-containing protein [Gammaproteobacteria bacterium]|jgi:hypothetical protein